MTGFEPFGESKVNPSILACWKLDGKKFNGYDIVVKEIPLRFYEIQDILKAHIEKYKPASIVSTGQGGGTYIALERVGINLAALDNFPLPDLSFLQLDAEGAEPFIVRGAIKTIEKFKPVISMENGHVQRSLMNQIGYKEVDQSMADTIYVPRE